MFHYYRLVQLRNGKYQIHSSITPFQEFCIYTVTHETRWLWLAKRIIKRLRDEAIEYEIEKQGNEVVKVID